MNVLRRIGRGETPIVPVTLVDKQTSRLHCYTVLAISDAMAVAASFIGANAVISLRAPVPIEHGFVMLGLVYPLFAFQALSNSTYGAATLEHALLGARRAARALAIAGGLVLLIAYLLKASGEFSRAVFSIGFATSFVLMIVARRLLEPYIDARLSGSAHTTLVIRDGVTYVPNSNEIVLSVDDLCFDPMTKDPRAYDFLAHATARADRMVIACEPARATAWAPVLRSLAIDGEILTDIDDKVGAIGMRLLGERRTLVINHGPMTLSARALKRAFDIAFSSIALLVLLPVFLVTAMAIRLESSGSVFFRQERIGRGNRIFRIFKFRSMFIHSTDEHAATLTSRGDARVTRVGAVIRRTSIDELPQLLNVLRGDMSVVGPRPHALGAKAADLLYWEADPRYRQRHVIKPGMTGLAQVRGFRGNTRVVEDLTNRLQADLEYVANWSLRHDISIIAKTIRVMLHANAY